ncbi:hypothetical protein FJ366_01910 [Candidatus Dependentiae bacterium]|nr:hypothetical protein [Candidatus Dependentiae bacterium]
MINRYFVLFLAFFSSVLSAAGSTKDSLQITAYAKNAVEFWGGFATGIQSADWNRENTKKIFAPMVGLSILESLLLQRLNLGRNIVGDHRDFNTKTTIALLFASRMMYHVLPSILGKRGFLHGVKSFAQGGQLAVVAAMMMLHYPDNSVKKAFLAMVFLSLMAWQFYEVYQVHQQVKKELSVLKKADKIYLQFRPNAEHDVKLPAYCTQNVLLLCGMGASMNGIAKSTSEYFRKEVRNPDEPRYHFLRQNNDILLPGAFFASGIDRLMFNSMESFFKLLFIPLGLVSYFATSIYKIYRFHKSGQFQINRAFEKLPKVFQPVKDVFCKYEDFSWGWDKNLMFFPVTGFIPKHLFDQLSSGLRQKIDQLNHHDLLLKAYNLFGGAECAYDLFRYTHQLWDDGPGRLDNPVAARKRQLNYIRRMIIIPPNVINDQLQAAQNLINQLTPQQLFNLAEQDPDFLGLGVCNFGTRGLREIDGYKQENNGASPWNFMEYSLQQFLAFNHEYPLTVRQRARAMAREIMRDYRPRSFIAQQTLAATADLEAQEAQV